MPKEKHTCGQNKLSIICPGAKESGTTSEPLLPSKFGENRIIQ
jgi:hypothetical protein